jgi:hypothetical protein
VGFFFHFFQIDFLTTIQLSSRITITRQFRPHSASKKPLCPLFRAKHQHHLHPERYFFCRRHSPRIWTGFFEPPVALAAQALPRVQDQAGETVSVLNIGHACASGVEIEMPEISMSGREDRLLRDGPQDQ